MIKISVDEAEALDRLAILMVKSENRLKVGKEMANLLIELGDIEALRSKEFQALRDANEQVFRLVELAKQDKVKASEVWIANHARYKAKKKLQRKWFSAPLTEVKS